MSDRLRWGIASTGSIAAKMVAALRTVDGADVVAVGSRSQAAADRFAAEHGIARAHGSHDALCADPHVDIVYVASPHSAHAAMTIAALDAGKHVLCEKAFAVNAGQAAAMVEAAGRNGCFLMEAMWSWFLPPIIEVRELVRSGAIGDLTAVQTSFSVPIWDRAERLRLPELAGGAVLDLGVYPVAFTRYLLGAPSVVRAVGTLGDTGVDRNLAGVLHHPGGAVAAFVAGLDAASSCTSEIVGTAGTITLDAPFHCPSGYTIARAGAAPEHVDRSHRGLAHEAEHAMARIAAGHLESDVIPLATSVAVMETLDEIRAQIGLVLPGDLPT